MIFVFGSNLAGIHGAGAAKYALKYEGAIWGQGTGRQGNSFAIPTKDRNIQTLSLKDIQWYVDRFIVYARYSLNLDFKVTQIGCGLAGYKSEQIASMFNDAPENCFFDRAWEPYLGKDFNYWN